MRRLVLLAAALVAVAGCSSSTPSSTPISTTSMASPPSVLAPSSSGSAGLPTPDHVLVVVFENKDAEHNLALFSGSTQGVPDDSCPHQFSAPNLGRQLLDSGHTFAGYSEDLPSSGFQGCSAGGYARKHNPWVDFPDLPASANQPYSALPRDFTDLPTVAFVVPNLCHDMHDCPVKTGDDWARAHLDSYVSWARDHDSLLVVTFDEDEGTPANGIATLLVGPMVRPGTSNQRIDHYSVLRTLEEMYGLAPLGEAARAETITGVWAAP